MSKKAPLKVIIPSVNLGILKGDKMSESKSKLQKKQEELESLELDVEIQGLEDKLKKRQSGDEVITTPQKDGLAEKLVTEIVLPIVKKNLEPDKSSSVAQDALKLANKALDKAARNAPPSSGNSINDIVNALGAFKDLIKDDSVKAQLDEVTQQVKELGERPAKEGDLDTIDRVLAIVDKIQERVKTTDGGSSDGYYDFERWKVEQGRKTTLQDRAFTMRIRQQDKDHDIKLAELGIEKERNNLFRDGFKRVGNAIALGLGEEDEFEEDEKSAPAKGRGQLIKEKCTECGAEILIPPEAQVEGHEIKCSECPANFTWE
ncbi:hypothetical protein ES703_16311 [subsurface metagenome]